MRKEYLKYVSEYTDRLEPAIARLETQGHWRLLERREVTNYSFNRDGVLFKMKVISAPEVDVESASLTSDSKLPKKKVTKLEK